MSAFFNSFCCFGLADAGVLGRSMASVESFHPDLRFDFGVPLLIPLFCPEADNVFKKAVPF